jgi:hypothetical protein
MSSSMVGNGTINTTMIESIAAANSISLRGAAFKLESAVMAASLIVQFKQNQSVEIRSKNSVLET